MDCPYFLAYIVWLYVCTKNLLDRVMDTLSNRLVVLNILDKHRLKSALILSVSSDRFTLTLFNWRFKMSVLPHVRKNPRFGDFSLESA